MRRYVAAAIALSCATGCFTTTVRSGHAPAREAIYERWHNGYLGGLIEGAAAIDLPRLCPEGWAEVRTSLEPMQTLVSLVTLLIYAPQTVTVVCAAPGAPAAAPAAGYDPSDEGYPERPPAALPIPPVTGPVSRPKANP